MLDYELDNDEAVIMQASGLTTDKREKADLLLTNKNIIQVTKGLFGGAKQSIKYPLSEMKVLNGKANILVEKSKFGSKQLALFFLSYELRYCFSSVFEASKWASAISKAHKARMMMIEDPHKESTSSGFIRESISKLVPSKNTIVSRTCKCNKCGAELTGTKGSEVECLYCHNKIIIV